MIAQTITITYPSDAHIECIIAPHFREFKRAMLQLGLTWDRTIVEAHEKAENIDTNWEK